MAVGVGVPAIRRDRLLEEVGGARIVLIGAPGGYGKTTFAEQLVVAWECAAVRARLRAPTNLDAFVNELMRGARRAGLMDVVETMEASGAQNRWAEDALDSFIGSLVDRDANLTVVLDDVHHLDAITASKVADAFGDISHSSRLVVAGRDLAHLSELASSPHAHVIRTDGLRMDQDEITMMLREWATPTLVDDLRTATLGWPAAIGLAVTRISQDPSWSPVGAGGARSLLVDLLDEIVAEAPDLAELAQFPLIDERVAEIVGGSSLFATAMGSGLLQAYMGRWFVVPDPIVEVVPASPPHDDALIAIAEHYRTYGETNAAISVLARGTRSDPLVDFLGTLHWTEMEDFGSRELEVLIAGLDDEDLEGHAHLLVNAARAVELVDPPRRTDWLARAHRIATRTDDQASQRSARAEQARDLVAAADLEQGRAVATEVLDETPAEEPLTRARALAALGRLEVFDCTTASLTRGAHLYAQAAALFREVDEPRWLSETLARRGYTALYMAGSPSQGAAEMQTALALLPTGDIVRGFWLTNYADLLNFLGRATEADAAVDEALDIGSRRRDRTVTGMAWWTASWIRARRGDHDSFLGAITECERNLGSWVRAGQKVEFLASCADHFALLGDTEGYSTYVVRATDAARESGYVAPIELAQARYEAMYGEAEQADRLLGQLDRAVGVVPSSRPGRLILQALAQARLGHDEPARQLVAEAQALTITMRVPDLLRRFEQPVLDLLERSLAEPVSALALPDDHQPAVIVRVLGGFSASAGTRDCTPQPGHPASLVKLLALRGSVTTDAAIDTLWPEADLATGRSRLRNLLNRLKERSGEVVVRDADTLRFHDSVVTDLAVFEEAAGAALSAEPGERVGLARHGLALYTGELLPGDVYDDWTAGPRERLKRRFLALVDLVAEDAVDRGDADEAARLLDLGIAAEPLDEARYVRLCSVLVSQGRVSMAREVAARAVGVLEEIGSDVSPELRKLTANEVVQRGAGQSDVGRPSDAS